MSIFTRSAVLVRERISPRLTNLYARLGFAHRRELAGQLSTTAIPITNHDALLDELARRGILKSSFRDRVASPAQIEHHMLSGRITQARLDSLSSVDVNAAPLFAARHEMMARIIPAISNGLDTITYHLPSIDTRMAMAYSLGIGSAVAIGATLGGLGIAGAAGLGLLAAKFNDRLPLQGRYHYFGDAARFFSRKIAPFTYAAGGVMLGKTVYDANLNIENIFDVIGLKATMGYVLGVLGLASYFIGKKIHEFNRSYLGHLDPGEKNHMRLLMFSAATSVVGEVHYSGARVLLWGAASAYIISNTLAALGALPLIPLALPVVGVGAAALLRSSHHNDAGRRDHLKIYAPVWGLAAGTVSAIAFAIGTGTIIPAIAFGAFWGSFGTLFLSEFHGVFHSTNTSLGFMASLRAPSKDLVGEAEAMRLTERLAVEMKNPHTGVPEHTYGLLYSVLFNRKPNNYFFCMFDKILAENANNRTAYQNEKRFIQWVKDRQAQIYGILLQGVFVGTATADRYRQLAANLRALADYFDGALVNTINAYIQANSGLFDKHDEIAEYLRANTEELHARADEFRRAAERLERKLQHGWIDDADFRKEWRRVADCYDPDKVKITPFARKTLSGDEKMVRKVENVATGSIDRGLIVYRGWQQESIGRLPVEELIVGTWTQVPNPSYREDAKAGTLAASKFVMVRTDVVLTDLQRSHRAFLSTSSYVESAENEPAAGQGFALGTTPLTITVNGDPVPLPAGSFYFVNGPDQNQLPRISHLNFRPGVTALPPQYRLPYFHAGAVFAADEYKEDAEPHAFVIPAYDYTLMMDKNDAQTVSYLVEPAIIERARQDIYLNLIFRQPVDGDVEVVNPHPDRTIDLQFGLPIVDGNVEISYGGQVIPYKPDRGAVHVGFDEDVDWKSLKGAEAAVNAGQIVGFTLIYGKRKNTAGNTHRVALPPSLWPRYISSLPIDLTQNGPVPLAVNNFTAAPQRDGDMSWLKIYYTDGTIGFARVPDGKRPILMHKDLYTGTGRPIR